MFLCFSSFSSTQCPSEGHLCGASGLPDVIVLDIPFRCSTEAREHDVGPRSESFFQCQAYHSATVQEFTRSVRMTNDADGLIYALFLVTKNQST